MTKTKTKQIDIVQAPSGADDGWKLYRKQHKTRSKRAETAYRAGFAHGRNRSARNILNFMEAKKAKKEKGKKK